MLRRSNVGNRVASGSATITGLSVAKALSANGALPAGVTRAMVDVDGQSIRFWLDGSTPTSTQGHLVNVGDQILLENGNEVVNAKFIEASPGATIQVTFFSGDLGE